jgi:hypothetical protein
MDQDIDNVSVTGKSGGGKKGAGKSEAALETGPPAIHSLTRRC